VFRTGISICLSPAYFPIPDTTVTLLSPAASASLAGGCRKKVAKVRESIVKFRTGAESAIAAPGAADRAWPSLARRLAAAVPASLVCGIAAAQDGGPKGPGLFELLMPLVIVIAAGALAWYLVRRRGSFVRSDGPVQLVQVMPVGTRERLLLVRIDNRYCLLGATPVQISPLTEWSVPPETGPDTAKDGSTLS